MSQRNYEQLRAQGKCVTCGTNEFPIAIGRANCARCIEKHREWRSKPENRAKSIAWNKAWKARNQERVKELERHQRDSVKSRAMALYGGACACCGEDGITFLTIDHIYGGGKDDREAIGNKGRGHRFYQHLITIERRSDLQVLCFNCHHGKTHYGACPHRAALREVLTPCV